MDRLKTKQLMSILKDKYSIENVFSSLIAALIVVLLFLMLISYEEERFVKNVHIHYIMVFFTIMIIIMQASLRLNTSDKKKIKFRNLKPSQDNQRIMRNNVFGGIGDRSRSPIARGRYAEGYKEKEVFYTPKSSYHNTEVRHRNRQTFEVFETPFSGKFKHSTAGKFISVI
jgi:hypothetical protein